MKHQIHLRIGPIMFRIGSAWPGPIKLLNRLYQAYPRPAVAVPDFTVRLEPSSPLRRWIRPNIDIRGDFMLPEAQPLPLAHGVLAAEMAMNLQMALGQRRYLLLHASMVERDGKALMMTGLSGAGKSTLSAQLGERGWRFMGDEFALIDPNSGHARGFPRAISLKNEAVEVMQALIGTSDRFGPLLTDTPKGTIRHLMPWPDAIARMDEPARPALLLFPRFGHPPAIRPIGAAEVFMRLTQSSTNYVTLGEAGFRALTQFVHQVPARAVDYNDTASAIDLVEQTWAELA